jgi:hypothetical protein
MAAADDMKSLRVVCLFMRAPQGPKRFARLGTFFD